jgi:acetate kinase
MPPTTEPFSLLAVNGGSSSLKTQLFRATGADLQPLCAIRVDNLTGDPCWRFAGEPSPADGHPLASLERLPAADRHCAALRGVITWLRRQPGVAPIAAVGHRVVHGGDLFSEPVAVSKRQLKALHDLSHLAPLHQGINVDLIEACREVLPEVPQVACFDTMFHQCQSDLERCYALPEALSAGGLKRYGFHGISYDYVWRQLQREERAGSCGATVIAHLGAGASLCAIRDGASVATTMGFSTLDGVPMGSRSGHLDPGVLLYLLREHGMDADQMEDLLYRRSGLLGLSGLSGDMRELRRSQESRARFAIDQFCYRVVREIGSLAAALGGLDTLVFTGGIGENDAALREQVVTGCEWLGARLDPQANLAGSARISSNDSRVTLRVVPTSEESMIAQYTLALL